MSSDVVDILVLSLVAAINPTLFAAVTVMLLLPHPRRLMLGYLLGAYATRITCGLLIVFVLHGSSAQSTSKNTVSPPEDIVIGLLVLGIAFVLATGRAPPLQEETRAGSLFDFDHDHAELSDADVLERVRWKRVGPEDVGRLRLAIAGSSVEQDVAVRVAADEVSGAEDVLDAWPPMRVHWRGRADRDRGQKHSYAVVLEQELMVLRGRDAGIQIVWPRPAISIRTHQRPDPGSGWVDVPRPPTPIPIPRLSQRSDDSLARARSRSRTASRRAEDACDDL